MKAFRIFICLFLLLIALVSCTASDAVNEASPSAPLFSDAPLNVTDIVDSSLYDEFIEKQEKEDRISFLAAGDNLIHSALICCASMNAGGENTIKTDGPFDFTPFYTNIAEAVASADLAFINQETPLAGDQYPYKGYPRFNGPYAAGEALVSTGFDIVNIATNHMVDVGEGGLEASIAFWENQPVTLIGGYRNQEDFNNIRIVEKNGITIAFLSYATFINRATKLPDGSEYVIPYPKEETVERQTALAKELADVVIVSIHWGKEYAGEGFVETNLFTPNSTQKRIANLLVSCNVDVILGHHPHVLEAIEERERPDGGKTLLFYSLGNLISAMEYSRNMVGGLFTFDIVRNDDKISIENVLLTPTISHYEQSNRNIKLYYLEDYSDELLSRHGAKDSSERTISEFIKIVTDNIDQKYLPAYYQSSTNGEN